MPVSEPRRVVSAHDLEWVRDHWIAAGKLMRGHGNFSIAFQALSECVWIRSAPLATVLLFGGLQQLFVSERYGIGKRLEARVSEFLEDTEESREKLSEHIRKLWDARSGAAHGNSSAPVESLLDTYALLRSVLLKIVEANHVPFSDES